MDYTSFAPNGKTNKPNLSIPELPQPRKSFTPKFFALIVAILIIAGATYAGIHYWQNKYNVAGPSTSSNQVVYRNEQYGFEIDLPQSWAGYSVMTQQWQGTYVSSGGKVTATGPEIIIRNPAWAQSSQTEDMPVMVFTPGQWQDVKSEQLAVSAAPFPPSLLGQNSQYVLALPPRYNYDFKTGYQEVDQLVHHLKAFEPGTSIDTSSWQTYSNNQYGFQIKFPPDWSGYKISSGPVDNYVFGIDFCAPTKDTTYIDQYCGGQKSPGYQDLLGLVFFTHAQWSVLEQNGETHGGDIGYFFVASNSYYVVGGGHAQDTASDLVNQFEEIPQILSTFKFTGVSASPSATPVSGQGILNGHADVGPNCPVEQAGNPCTPSPQAYTSRQVGVFTQTGTLVASAHLDTSGNYQFGLNPGTYVVKASGINVSQMSVTEGTVTIKSGQTATLNFSIDTGIR